MLVKLTVDIHTLANWLPLPWTGLRLKAKWTTRTLIIELFIAARTSQVG